MSAMQCPASMCPLVAKDGSPWTGQFAAPCPGHDNLEIGGCPWWGMACASGGIQASVEEAAQRGGTSIVAGPNKPRRGSIGSAKEFNCPRAEVCQWQKQAEKAGRALCPPRDALARGIDPRVVLF